MYKEMMDTIGLVNTVDPELGAAMNRELTRQRQNIELIASENIVSPAVMAAMGSVLTNKYAEGLPGKRYYGGCVYVDEVENIAIQRACKLFGAKYANVQPHSGAQANLAVYFALLDLGDTVMGMDLSQGGHLTHGSPVNMSGKNYHFVSYGVNADGVIDYAELEKQVKKVRPKLIVAGASAYPRAIDFEKIAEIAHGYGAFLMVDMAHIAGLVAGGQHQSPVPYADVVTTTTHKTLRGPRGGLILTNNPVIAKRINSAVFPGTQGGPLEHVIAAKAVCFGEALKPEFKEYARKIVENAQALAAALQERGVKLVSGGTDNHLMLIDLRDEECTGKDLEARLDSLLEQGKLEELEKLLFTYIDKVRQIAPDFQMDLTITNPPVLIGLFIGGMLPFLFAALTMDAVGKAAQSIVVEVRRQFKSIPGLMEGKGQPDYAACVDMCTKSAQSLMIAPALIAVIVPVVVGLILGVNGVAGLLAGNTVTGFVLAIMMANSGGAWDNAKKYIESGSHGGKGSDCHKAAVVGDTVGDPFKDTSGPTINILIKLTTMVSIVFAGVVVTFHIL